MLLSFEKSSEKILFFFLLERFAFSNDKQLFSRY